VCVCVCLQRNVIGELVKSSSVGIIYYRYTPCVVTWKVWKNLWKIVVSEHLCHRCYERRFVKQLEHQVGPSVRARYITCRPGIDPPTLKMPPKLLKVPHILKTQMAHTFSGLFLPRELPYASAILGVVILSVRLSHACFVTNPKNRLAILLYHTKGQSF